MIHVDGLTDTQYFKQYKTSTDDAGPSVSDSVNEMFQNWGEQAF